MTILTQTKRGYFLHVKMFWMVLILPGCTCQKRMVWGDSEATTKAVMSGGITSIKPSSESPPLALSLWVSHGAGEGHQTASSHNRPGTDHAPENLIITHTTHKVEKNKLSLSNHMALFFKKPEYHMLKGYIVHQHFCYCANNSHILGRLHRI